MNMIVLTAITTHYLQLTTLPAIYCHIHLACLSGLNYSHRESLQDYICRHPRLEILSDVTSECELLSVLISWPAANYSRTTECDVSWQQRWARWSVMIPEWSCKDKVTDDWASAIQRHLVSCTEKLYTHTHQHHHTRTTHWHRASTSTRWHFAFGAMLSQQRNLCINCKSAQYHTTTTTVLWPFFLDHPGEPVPEDNFWTLWCKGRLTEGDTLTIWLGATPSRLSSANLQHPPIFLQTGCHSCHPTNSVKALKATGQICPIVHN